MLRMLGLGPRPLSDQLKLKLPALNSFVALAMTSALRGAGLYLAAQRRPRTAVRTVPVPSFGAAAAAGR